MELLLNLDQSSHKTRAISLAAALKEALSNGRLRPGQKMPSVRDLSKVLSLARATVLKAYDLLERDGLIMTIPGAGTFVSRSQDRRAEQFEATKTEPYISEARTSRRVSLSSFTLSLTLRDDQCPEPALKAACDDLEVHKLWKRHLIRNWRADLQTIFESSPRQIKHSLKGSMSSYLSRARQITACAGQVVLAQSKTLLIDLVLRMALKPEAVVIAGEGLPPELDRLFRAHGANLVTVAVDENGINLDSITASGVRPALIYLNPSHHNPSGVTLSDERRKQVVAYARQTGAYILEDDLESHSQLPNHNRQTLQSRLPEQVFYFPSITDDLAEVINLGVMIVPACLKGKFSTPGIDDDLFLVDLKVLKEILSSGELEVNIRSRTKTLANLRRCLIYALTRYARNSVELITQTNSRVQVLRVKDAENDESEIIAQAASFGIRLISTGSYYAQAGERKEFLFALDEVEEENLEERIKAWAGSLTMNSRVSTLEDENEHHI